MLETIAGYLNNRIELSDEEVEQVARIARMRSCGKRVLLTREGETEQHLHYILKGLARKYFKKGDDEVVTQIAKEEEVISSSVSFLTRRPSEYFVETIEPCTILSFARNDIENLYRRFPRFQKLGRIIMTELMLAQEHWELERIKHSTKERFRRFFSTNTELFSRVPQKYLASYLNIKPETFSRLKHTLR